MSLDEATVARIAKLARIRIEDDQRAPLAAELSTILGWIEQLNEVDTANVPPMTSMDNVTLQLRADDIDPKLIAAAKVVQFSIGSKQRKVCDTNTALRCQFSRLIRRC